LPLFLFPAFGNYGRQTMREAQSNLPLAEKLEQARTELLDLSARNRLLNMPRGARARSVTVTATSAR